MRPNLLDFTPDGQAIINMPNFKEISFLENFGFSPIESVEQEISQADSPERAAFLEHYVKVFKETFTTPPPGHCYTLDEDSDKLEFEAQARSSFCFRNVRLLHTSAWYMMGHVDAEIKAVKRHIEELEAEGVVLTRFDEFVALAHECTYEEEFARKIQRKFEIGYKKARYLADTKLCKLYCKRSVYLATERDDYLKRLEFLQKLQPNGVMGAMYFDKKGIPFHMS